MTAEDQLSRAKQGSAPVRRPVFVEVRSGIHAPFSAVETRKSWTTHPFDILKVDGADVVYTKEDGIGTR